MHSSRRSRATPLVWRCGTGLREIPMVNAIFHFYGERGLANALLLDLQEAGQLLRFLGRIEF